MKILHSVHGVVAHIMFVLALVLAVILAYVVLNKSTDTNSLYPADALSVEEYKAWCPFRIGDPDPTIGVNVEFIAGMVELSRRDNEVIPPVELIPYHKLRQEVGLKRLQSVVARYMNGQFDTDEFFQEYSSINREYNEKFNQLEQELLEQYNIDMTKQNGCDAGVDAYIDE